MKKVVNILILVMINIFILIGCVNADMEGPHTYSAKAFISNENGSILYNWNLEKEDVLPKDTMFRIQSHYEGKEGYYHISGIKSGDTWLSGYVKKEDVSLTSDFVSEEGFLKNEDIRKVYVWQDECYLYKGPSTIYDKASEQKIPKGTILEYQYVSMEEDAVGGYGEYIYTTYEGVNGWVLNTNLAKLVPGKIMIPKENAKLLKEPHEDSSKVLEVTIPKYTELVAEYTIDSGYDFQYSKDSYYEITSSYSCYVHVTYNGVSGWIHSDDFASPNLNHTKFIIMDENTMMYNESGESLKIPYFEEIEFKYNYDYYYYIDYNGINGWIKGEQVAFPNSAIKSILIGNEEGAVASNAKGENIIIPYFTEIDSIMYEKYYSSNDEKIILNYNNEKVLLNVEDCMINDGMYDIYFTNNEITMFKAKNTNSEVICKIPKHSKIIEKYEYKKYINNYEKVFLYVEYDGYKGWINANIGYYNDTDLTYCTSALPDKLVEETKFKIYLTMEEIEVSNYSAGELTFKTVPANSKLVYIYTVPGQDGVDCVLYENEIYTVGWINDEEMKLIAVVDKDNLEEALSGDYIEEVEPPILDVTSGDKESDISGNNENVVDEEYTPKQTAIIAVIAAIIIAITAVVIMKLINKSKNK